MHFVRRNQPEHEEMHFGECRSPVAWYSTMFTEHRIASILEYIYIYLAIAALVPTLVNQIHSASVTTIFYLFIFVWTAGYFLPRFINPMIPGPVFSSSGGDGISASVSFPFSTEADSFSASFDGLLPHINL